MDALHVVARFEGCRYGEDTGVVGVAQGIIQVFHLVGLVAHETVRTLPDHAQTLLYGLFEAAADGHDLAYALHARTQLARNFLELGKVPAGYLADHIVEGRLEECRGILSDGVLKLEQAIAQTEFGGDEGQGIAGRLGRQGR